MSSAKPTLFILSLPHTQLTDEYVSCAYTQKARKLAIMMEHLGYEVVSLASEDFDKQIKGEKITCITKEKQQEFFGNNDHNKHFYNITWGPEEAHWVHFNTNAIEAIAKRIKTRDLILTFAGVCQKQVADAFPNNQTVEAGIGYEGVFSKYKVYESYAWQNYIHGRLQSDNGDFYETVIPNYWDTTEFPFAETRKAPSWLPDGTNDYFLYIGRLIDRKGYRIAQEVCQKLGKRLILAGQMDVGQEFSGYGEYIGTVDVAKRGELMANATAVFTPTIYLGPFEGTHVEAQLAGAPVITTPFGVYNETIKDGYNGFRCYTFQDFLNAVEEVEKFGTTKRKNIRNSARKNWGMSNVAKQYDTYFKRLMTLFGGGWYELK